MKKRVLMMMLAGIFAFAMIGCGSDPVESENPDNGDQIEDMEEKDEDQDQETDQKEETDQEEEEGDSQQTSGTVSTQKPAEQKPTAQKPAEQKPATQQPATKPATKPEQPATKPEKPATKPDNGSATDLSSMTLEEIIKASYGDLELPSTGETEIDPSDANQMQWCLGTTDITFKRAVASEALMSSVAHSVIALEVEDDADVEAVAKKLKESVDPRKWICVEAEQVSVAYRGSIILLAMSNSGNAIVDNFKAL